MSNYYPNKTKFENVLVSGSIVNYRELGFYEGSEMEYNGRKHKFVLAYFDKQYYKSGKYFTKRFYSIEPDTKISDHPNAFTVVTNLSCLDLPKISKRKETILKLIEEHYENNPVIKEEA